MTVPKRASDRVAIQLRRYQSILAGAKARDVSESDTVVIIADMLADVLGYDKYSEVTTEYAIRSTFVDLAVKVGAEVRFLIEAKAVGVELKDQHVRQCVDYGANLGIEWVVLTNGCEWRVYKVHFRQPVDKSLVFNIDVLQSNPRNPLAIECFGNLSKEGFTASSMATVFQQQQATSKFSLAAVIQTETVISTIRRELRRAFPGLKVSEEELLAAIQTDVLKREVIDSDEARQAIAFTKKALRQANKPKPKTSAQPNSPIDSRLTATYSGQS